MIFWTSSASPSFLGAKLKLVSAKPYKDDNNFVKVAARLADELRPSNNNGVIWANQFDNTANAKGHYEGTGKEIGDQTNGKIDGFVCSSLMSRQIHQFFH